jgi:hypothetical protein
MGDDLVQKAVSEALKGAWVEAISINLEIIDKNSNDVDALNRLARAYAETGNIQKAKTYSKKVLSIDPFNKIADKCLTKWKELKKDGLCSGCPTITSTFIEEPGKTKVISLINLGPNNLLANLDAGDEVVINPQGHSISILTLDGKYIGRLPDNIGARIKNLIKGGNVYGAVIKSNIPGSVKVFIREVSCSQKQSSIPSFLPDKSDFVSNLI